MIKRSWMLPGLPALLFAGVAGAQQFPILDMVANRVIERYRGATCEQLWEHRGQSKSPEEQRVMEFLRDDPQMRTAFFNQVSGPIVNKMFECGLIP